MGACVVGLRAEVLKVLSIRSWSNCRDDSPGRCATWRASWTTLTGAGCIRVGGSGKANVATVGATFGVLAEDRRLMPFFSTLPAGVRSTLVRDRLGRLLYSHANNDNDVRGRRRGRGGTPCRLRRRDREDEIAIGVRGCRLLRKLGSRSGQARTIGASGTYAIVSRVVAFASFFLVPIDLKMAACDPVHDGLNLKVGSGSRSDMETDCWYKWDTYAGGGI